MMLGLARGGSCNGLALRIAAEAADTELGIVFAREMVSTAYNARWLRVATDGGPVRAIAFVANPRHVFYAGRVAPEEAARHIAFAEGELGSSREYLYNTVSHLNELGIGDSGMRNLLALVRRYRAAARGGRMTPVHVIGGGLAGSEAAWQIARAGVKAVLHEMRPIRATEVHETAGLAELVCSNSFRSDDADSSAIGLLHEEMRRLDSVILAAADANKVPAGGALAVDRDGFSRSVEAAVAAEPLIEIERGEVAGLPPEDWGNAIVATGPLTSPPLAEAIRALTGEESLAFFDAIAPIVYPRIDRFRHRLVPEPLRQGGPRGHGLGLHQLPDGRGAVRRLHRRARGRGKYRVQGLGARDALFRGLPADRGDGRARGARRSASGR